MTMLILVQIGSVIPGGLCNMYVRLAVSQGAGASRRIGRRMQGEAIVLCRF